MGADSDPSAVVDALGQGLGYRSVAGRGRFILPDIPSVPTT